MSDLTDTTQPEYQVAQSRRLLDHIGAMPLWVKQVLYISLQQEFKGYFSSQSLLDITPDDAIALFVPRLTTVAEDRLSNVDAQSPTMKIVRAASQEMTVLDMCLNFGWTLEQSCSELHAHIDTQWILPPESPKAMATLDYLSNHIRLGEYLVKMGSISDEQLEQALRTQVYIKEAMNEHSGIANIMINLGYITRQDTESILFLKEESKKPLTADSLLTISH